MRKLRLRKGLGRDAAAAENPTQAGPRLLEDRSISREEAGLSCAHPSLSSQRRQQVPNHPHSLRLSSLLSGPSETSLCFGEGMKLLWLRARWKGLQGRDRCTSHCPWAEARRFGGHTPHRSLTSGSVQWGQPSQPPHCAGVGWGQNSRLERRSRSLGARRADPHRPHCMRMPAGLQPAAMRRRASATAHGARAGALAARAGKVAAAAGPATAWWCGSRLTWASGSRSAAKALIEEVFPETDAHVQLGQRGWNQDPHARHPLRSTATAGLTRCR